MPRASILLSAMVATPARRAVENSSQGAPRAMGNIVERLKETGATWH